MTQDDSPILKATKASSAAGRNSARFPEDFMFSLTREEIMRISQIVTSSAPFRNETLKFSKAVFDAIRQLMAQPEPKEKKIGFRARERQAHYKTSGRKSIRIDDGASVTERMTG